MRRKGKRGRVGVLGKVYDSSKIVWIWHHKALPPARLLRVNGDVTDDRIENLGVRLPDKTVEGGGNRWIARAPTFTRRGDILGVFKSFEKACAAVDRHQRGEDLV